jgi:thiamine biosynthesis lipoprotein
MGTLFRIVVYTQDSLLARKASAAAFARVDSLNNILSDYREDSELSQLSSTAGTGKIVPVSRELWEVLSQSVQVSRETNGAFDITVGPYVSLWRRASRQNEFPSAELLQKAKQAVGYQHIKLFPAQQSVELMVPGMRLDVGAIGKGYAVDEAMKILQEHGINTALVDGGGNIVVSKAPPDKKGWEIKIFSPQHNTDTSSQTLLLEQAAVATSGDIFQYVALEGNRYSHILDPRTGIGLTDQIMVTVIAKNGTMADYLSTAVSVLGPENGLRQIEKTKTAAAIVTIEKEGKFKIMESGRFAHYKTK